MGCNSSNAASTVAPAAGEDELKDNRPIPPPTSFEIPLGDNEEVAESLIKRHPPKRLEERLTKQLSPPQTISDLCDKLASAEIRRQSILRERVNNIRNNLKKEGIEPDDFNEEAEEAAVAADGDEDNNTEENEKEEGSEKNQNL